MARQDIRILVIDRMLGQDKERLEEIGHGGRGLESEVKALEERGYNVTATRRTQPSADYDIIIAHPFWDYIDIITQFHKEHPEIPIVMYSVMYNRASERKIQNHRFSIDTDGIYLPHSESIQDFLRFIKYITGKVLSKGKAITK